MSFNQISQSTRREAALSIFIVLLLALQIHLLFSSAFHWDEFYELSILFFRDNGSSIGILRRGLHYLIWPLRYLPLPEYELLYLARTLIYGIGTLGIYLYIYRIGKDLKSPLYGKIALFITITTAAFFQSGIEYRTDQICTFLFLISLYKVIRQSEQIKTGVIIALCVAVAVFINPKAIYHCGTLAVAIACLYVRSKERRKVLRMLLLAAPLCAATGLLLHLAHMGFYGVTLEAVSSNLKDSASVGFGTTHGAIFKWNFIAVLATGNLLLLPLVIVGFYRVGLLTAKRRITPLSIITLCAFVELLSICIHQGVYPYYALNILPLLALVAAYPIWRLFALIRLRRIQTGSGWKQRLPAHTVNVIVATCVLGIAIRLPYYCFNSPEQQKLHIDYLNEAFPADIPYADGIGILARHRNLVPFFSHKGLLQYLNAGRPRFGASFNKTFPGFIIESERFPVSVFHQRDRAFIDTHYISQLGGKLRIHGKLFTTGELIEGVTFHARLSHWYHWSTEQETLLIDGAVRTSPAFLDAGTHTVRCIEDCHKTTLALGKRPLPLIVPSIDLPPTSSGSFSITSAGRYFAWPPCQGTDCAGVTFGTLKFTRSMPHPQHRSLWLKPGIYDFSNHGGRQITLQRLGPLFISNAISRDYWASLARNPG